MELKSANKKRNITWIIAGLSMSITVTIYGCGSNTDTPKVETPFKVSTQILTKSSFGEELKFSGSIQADNSVQLAFSLPGKVANVAVQEGQQVAQGQLLASLETTEYQSAFTIANAGLEQAQDNFNRADELHLKGSLTEKDYIAAKIALTQARANSDLSKKRLSDSYLKAPFKGIVTARLTEAGASAAPGVPAFTLTKTDYVYAQASVSETDISKLSVGSDASVFIASINTTLNGKISIINPQADLLSKTYSIKIEIPNTIGQLMPGMIGEINVKTGNKVSAMTVPFESVFRDADDLTYVYVVNKDKRAVRKRVNVGSLTDSTIIVTSGLKEGELIITKGQTNIQEGQLLSIN